MQPQSVLGITCGPQPLSELVVQKVCSFYAPSARIMELQSPLNFWRARVVGGQRDTREPVTGGAFRREGTHNTGRSEGRGRLSFSAMVSFRFRTQLRKWLSILRVGCLSTASGTMTRCPSHFAALRVLPRLDVLGCIGVTCEEKNIGSSRNL